ncbi:uncharacterized protein BX664DRAFT_335905 [Halteromyces radiatus]|uniref:uncharacterized protein n=1 Tax=Halteromyces radiatus TaxID=101107 RepID=UPI00221E4FC0|nr:uncharacterized protein BX664DRAFT_335905 [Halteromyces radiatus]KAI8086481.1 hypothetical protein BX664DRAFT_335905 [Halteromyces radiatus]
MYFKSILIILVTFVTLSFAIVLNPHITSPTSSTKWRAGSQHTITWDTENVAGGPIPDTYKGTIKLGYLDPKDGPNEHLQWELASDFLLNKGSQVVTLPADLETKRTYIIVLMGDSGNASPQFAITAAR